MRISRGVGIGAVVAAGLIAVCCSAGGGADGSGKQAAGGSGRSAVGGAQAAPGSGPAPTAGAPTAGDSSPTDVADVLPRALVRTAALTVAVRGAAAVPAQADRADAIAERVGGEVDSDDRSTGARAQATVVLRVPPAALQPVLHDLDGLGHEISRTLSTTDVTEQVADVSSRVASAQQAIAALRSLYGRAAKISDVIAIETQLSGREANLESLEAQQRALAAETALATVTLTLQAAAPAPVRHHKAAGGWGHSLRRGWHGFVTAVEWLIAGLALLLPFLVVAGLLALGGRLVWSRRRRPAAG